MNTSAHSPGSRSSTRAMCWRGTTTDVPLRHRERIRKHDGRRGSVNDVIALGDTIAKRTLPHFGQCRP